MPERTTRAGTTTARCVPGTGEALSVSSLEVSTLGCLRVRRDGSEIPASAWQRRKSQTLFVYLLCARPGRAHKEELVEVLSPGRDVDSGTRILHVALSDLRAALASDLPRRQGRAFVSRWGERYGLDVGPRGRVDVEVFQAECEASRQAESRGDCEGVTRHLRNAEKLYGGDFLVEERYADWVEAFRQRLRDQYTDVLLRLMHQSESAGEARGAADYARKLLAVDPYLEGCYRDLMRYSKALGDRGAVIDTYLRCQQAMREGFDSDAAPETRALAEALLERPLRLVLRRYAAARRRTAHRRGAWATPGARAAADR